MEKYIAFNVYSRNEHGAAVAVGDRDGVEKDVYLAKDADKLIAGYERTLAHFLGPDGEEHVNRFEAFVKASRGICATHSWGAPPGQDSLLCPYCVGVLPTR